MIRTLRQNFILVLVSSAFTINLSYADFPKLVINPKDATYTCRLKAVKSATDENYEAGHLEILKDEEVIYDGLPWSRTNLSATAALPFIEICRTNISQAQALGKILLVDVDKGWAQEEFFTFADGFVPTPDLLNRLEKVEKQIFERQNK